MIHLLLPTGAGDVPKRGVASAVWSALKPCGDSASVSFGTAVQIVCQGQTLNPFGGNLQWQVTDYARRLRRKQPDGNDIWHMDEVVVSIAGKKHWLWRAVDKHGYVLDEIIQSRRNAKAAKRLLTRLLQRQGMPHAVSP